MLGLLKRLGMGAAQSVFSRTSALIVVLPQLLIQLGLFTLVIDPFAIGHWKNLVSANVASREGHK